MSPNTSNGSTLSFTSGTETLLLTRAEMRGGIIRGTPPGGDFVDYNLMGFGYTPVNSRYFGFVQGTVSNLTDITISATPSIPEGTAAGTLLGILDVPNTFTRHPAIISLTVIASNVALNNWFIEGCYLQTGKTQFDYETTPQIGGIRTATVTVRAQIEGTSEFIDRTFSFVITDAIAPSGLTVTAAYTGLATGTINQTPTANVSYSGLGTGTANANRHVVAYLAGWSNDPLRVFDATQTLTGATDGAKTMTKLAALRGGLANGNYAQGAMYIAKLPSDAAADLSVGSGSALTAQGVGVFNITGISSTTPYSYNTAAMDTVGGQLAMQLDLPANGVAVLGCTYGSQSANNKRHTGAIFTSAIAFTYFFRVTIAAGTTGPAAWEYSTDGLAWTSLASAYEGLVEGTGAAGTVMIGASFGPAT